METKEYTTIDKTGWRHGEWLSEPDKIQWQDEATKLPCLIVRGPLGALCGYVGVASGHPCFEVEYDGVDVDVHGGLTFSEFCREGAEEHGICHAPGPGEPDRVWWLGFDCGHSCDIIPQADWSFDRGMPSSYRDIAYVKRECTRLAAQLAAVALPLAAGSAT